jgi:hypothetical protein
MAEIRAGLEARLATIPNVVTAAYPIDSPPDLTLQVMGQDAIEYDLAMQRGLDRLTFVIQGFSGSPDSQAAQENLDLWLAPSGTNSVKAAVEGDITLGGVVVSARVARAAGSQLLNVPSRGTILGTHFYVDIYNTGK